MDESRKNRVMESTRPQRRGGVYAIADVIEELMAQYSARVGEWTDAAPEEEALAV